MVGSIKRAAFPDGEGLKHKFSEETMAGLTAKRGQAKPAVAGPENGCRKRRSIQRQRRRMNANKSVPRIKRNRTSVPREKQGLVGSLRRPVTGFKFVYGNYNYRLLELQLSIVAFPAML